MHPNDLLTTKEAAEYLRTTYWGFDAWVRRHGVPCERYGRKRLFRRSVLDRVIRQWRSVRSIDAVSDGNARAVTI